MDVDHGYYLLLLGRAPQKAHNENRELPRNFILFTCFVHLLFLFFSLFFFSFPPFPLFYLFLPAFGGGGGGDRPHRLPLRSATERNNAELKLKLILFMIYTCTRKNGICTKAEWINEITWLLNYANQEYVVGRDKNLERSMLLTWRLKRYDVWTVTMSFGSEFKIGTIRQAKKNFLILVLAIGTTSLKEWPRNELFVLKLKNSVLFKQFILWTMLKHMTRSAIKRLCSRLCSLSVAKRSWYGRCWQPGMRLVNVRWTLSISSICVK